MYCNIFYEIPKIVFLIKEDAYVSTIFHKKKKRKNHVYISSSSLYNNRITEATTIKRIRKKKKKKKEEGNFLESLKTLRKSVNTSRKTRFET